MKHPAANPERLRELAAMRKQLEAGWTCRPKRPAILGDYDRCISIKTSATSTAATLPSPIREVAH